MTSLRSNALLLQKSRKPSISSFSSNTKTIERTRHLQAISCSECLLLLGIFWPNKPWSLGFKPSSEEGLGRGEQSLTSAHVGMWEESINMDLYCWGNASVVTRKWPALYIDRSLYCPGRDELAFRRLSRWDKPIGTNSEWLICLQWKTVHAVSARMHCDNHIV